LEPPAVYLALRNSPCCFIDPSGLTATASSKQTKISPTGAFAGAVMKCLKAYAPTVSKATSTCFLVCAQHLPDTKKFDKCALKCSLSAGYEVACCTALVTQGRGAVTLPFTGLKKCQHENCVCLAKVPTIPIKGHIELHKCRCKLQECEAEVLDQEQDECCLGK
jgi:hypothetical protein